MGYFGEQLHRHLLLVSGSKFNVQRKVVSTWKGIAERESSTRSAHVADTECLQTLTE